jgi:hypothetical protein
MEVAAVVLAIVAALLAGALVVALGSLQRSVRALETVVDRLERETLPVVTELRDAVRRAGDDVERVEALLDGAEAVGRAVDGASRVARRAITGPAARVAALGTGVSRAGRRLRDGEPEPVPVRRRGRRVR